MENKNIITALVKAQLEIKNPMKDKKGQHKNSYASLDSILDAVREPLARNGVTLLSTTEKIDGDLYIIIHAFHLSGESLSTKFPLSIERQGPQGMAAARTYACRYGISNLLSLACEEDDDGEGAQRGFESSRTFRPVEVVQTEKQWEGMNEFQLEALEDLLDGDEEIENFIVNSYRAKYKNFRYDSLKDLPSAHYGEIKSKIAAMKKTKRPVVREA